MKAAILSVLALLFLPAPAGHAQAPGVPIEKSVPMAQDRELLAKLAALRDAGRGLDTAALKEALRRPTPAAVSLPPCRTAALRPAEIWQSAQRSRVWVGWHYLCHKCDNWHLNLAGGYPVAADGIIATCHHVAEPGPEIREGRLVAVDSEGKAYPVTAVIAASPEMDACLLRAEGLNCEPLPLNHDIRPGDAAWLLSNPLGVSGYFTSGMVNRFYWHPKTRGRKVENDDFTHLRMNVSTDWAPGSSGSPLLDACGNAIGHVSTISHLGDAKNSSGKGVAYLTLHEAVPARGVISLVRWAVDAAARPADAAPAPTFAALESALAARDFTEAASLADALEQAGPDEPARFRILAARCGIAIGSGKEAEAAPLAVRLAEAPSPEPSLLNEVAWRLVTALSGPKPETIAAAEQCARRAVALHERRDPASMDTLARVCFLLGKKDEAIRLQEEAVAMAQGDLRTQLEKTLADYRADRLPDVREG